MLEYWIWLAERKGLNHRQKLALAEYFQSAEALWQAESYADEWKLSAGALDSLADKDLTNAQNTVSRCQELGIRILTVLDARYPARLRSIADPPTVLYYKGTLPDFDREAAVGVVGTRRASAYGLMSAEKLARQIAAHGGLVVSGMAAGIDAQAGWGALRAGASTVGVLGGGVDHIYPASNRELYRAVEQQGCLISEYPPGTRPSQWTFPQRNRIVSGLSCAVLVVEAPEKSGTMITARDAMKQGRDLFVVPGQIDSAVCQGSNALLRDGARLASCGWDVVGEYEARFPDKLHRTPKERSMQPYELPETVPSPPPRPRPKPVPAPTPRIPTGSTAEEQAILNALAEGEKNVDELIVRTGLETQKVLAMLTMLEIKGMVTTLPGRRVIINS